MNKIILSIALITMSAFASSAHAADVYPTNGIYQEMAGTIKAGEISIDLLNNTGYRSSVRIGMFGGEVIYTPNVLGAVTGLIGYKHPFNNNMAAYGLFNYDSVTGSPDLLLGFSYSGGTRKFMYNANAEIFAPGTAGAANTTQIKAGAYYAISTQGTGRMYIAGELVMDTAANTTDLYAALRFAPKKNVNIDVGVYQSIGGGNSTIGVPIFFRLTLGV